MTTQVSIPYSGQPFCQHHRGECAVIFESAPYARGSTDEEGARAIAHALNESARAAALGVTFDARMIRGNQLEGGSCSALALHIAKVALLLIGQLQGDDTLDMRGKAVVLSNEVGRAVQQLVLDGRGQNGASAAVKKSIRTKQQAFNTIAVAEGLRLLSKTEPALLDMAVHLKMQALAGHYELAVDESTPRQPAGGDGALAQYIERQRRCLTDGTYLLRLLHEAYNHKLEESGHTAVYIKAFASELYFDPALGHFQLLSQPKNSAVISNAINSARQRFQVDSVSFHRLRPSCGRHVVAQVDNGPPPLDEESLRGGLLRAYRSMLALLAQPAAGSWTTLGAGAMDLALLLQGRGCATEAEGLRQRAIRLVEESDGRLACECVITPPLTGIYEVGVRRYLVAVDSHSTAPQGLAPAEKRLLEIDVHYPAIGGAAPRYKALTQRQADTVVVTKALSRSQPGLEPVAAMAFPVLLFSPGMGAGADDYQHIVEEVASHGFCVIVINHPSGGLYARHLGSSQPPPQRLEEPSLIAEGILKGADMAALAHVLHSGANAELAAELGCCLDVGRIGALGHSLGGSAAVAALSRSGLIGAAVDIDGRILYAAGEATPRQPILLLAAAHEREGREAFEKAYQALRDDHPSLARVDLPARHGDFSLYKHYRIGGPQKLDEALSALSVQASAEIVGFFKVHL